MFLIIVLVKVLCFFLADSKQRRQRHEARNYGAFADDAAATEGDETEAVVGVYFKIMEKITYRTHNIDPNEIEGEENKNI